MTAVSGSPDALADLAVLLAGQRDAHDELRRTLGRAIDGVPVSSMTLLLGVGDASAVAEDLGSLARSFDSLAGFVWGVAADLATADAALANVGSSGGSGSSPWTRLATPNGSGTVRTYARGTRRVYEGSIAGPLQRAGRTRTVTTGNPSVSDGWHSSSADISGYQSTRIRQKGVGTGRRIGTDHAHVDVNVFAGAVATGGVYAGVGDRQAEVTVTGTAQVGASASASATAGSSMLGVGATAQVFVGAQASGRARAGIGVKGVEGEVEARALVGGSADASTEVSLLGVRAISHVGVSYGAGFELKADASVGLDKVAFKLDLGATIGIGGSLGVDVSINPKSVVSGIGHVASGGGHALTSTVHAIGGLFG